MYDGLHNLRGTIGSTSDGSYHSVEINYGQRRTMAGEDYVFAFSFNMTPADPALGRFIASGWIPIGHVLEGPPANNTPSRIIAAMPALSPNHNSPDPRLGDAQEYVVVGADPSLRQTAPTDPALQSWYLGNTAVDRKVRSVVPDYTHMQASDYFTRPVNEVYLSYALSGNGGVADDVIPVGAHFVAINAQVNGSAPAALDVSMGVYPICSDTSDQQMHYRYGYVATPWGRRYGWMPTDVLRAFP